MVSFSIGRLFFVFLKVFIEGRVEIICVGFSGGRFKFLFCRFSEVGLG